MSSPTEGGSGMLEKGRWNRSQELSNMIAFNEADRTNAKLLINKKARAF